MISSLKVSLFNKYRLTTVLILCGINTLSLAQIPTTDQTRRSLVRVETVFGDCNGVLLNTSGEENRQLVLTARHCFDDNFALGRFVFGGLDWLPNTRITQSSWSTLNFDLLADSKDLDYALFELPEPIPEQFLPFAAGWNASPSNPLNTYGFSAIGDSLVPFEDIDRPSLFTNAAIEDFGGIPVENGAWWVKSWERGYTSIGSSGAALFDQWSRVVGVLSAGASTPEAPFNDFFSRMELIYQEVAVQNNLTPAGGTSKSSEGKEWYTRTKRINYNQQSKILGNLPAFEISESFELATNTQLYGVYIPMQDIDPSDLITVRVVQADEVLYEQMAIPGQVNARQENYFAFTEAVTLSGQFEIQLSNRGSAYFILLEGTTRINADNTPNSSQSIGLGLLTNETPDYTTPTQFMVFPNPVQNNLYITGASENDEFIFLDTQGNEVFPRVTQDYLGRRVFNVDSFTHGIYLLTLPSGEVIKLFIDN